jgi:hypothetical protein
VEEVVNYGKKQSRARQAEGVEKQMSPGSLYIDGERSQGWMEGDGKRTR